jgi:hypothetical protein
VLCDKEVLPDVPETGMGFDIVMPLVVNWGLDALTRGMCPQTAMKTISATKVAAHIQAQIIMSTPAITMMISSLV